MMSKCLTNKISNQMPLDRNRDYFYNLSQICVFAGAWLFLCWWLMFYSPARLCWCFRLRWHLYLVPIVCHRLDHSYITSPPLANLPLFGLSISSVISPGLSQKSSPANAPPNHSSCFCLVALLAPFLLKWLSYHFCIIFFLQWLLLQFL